MISIVIPVYNERKSLLPLWVELQAVIPRCGDAVEVIFVNDGSTDGSEAALDDIAAKHPGVRVIHFRRNFGQTAAMMAGIDHAQGGIVVPLDADLQNDPADIPLLLARLAEGYDVVSGWRRDRADNPLHRTIPSRLANILISAISRVRLRDYGCTLKAYRREVLADVRLYGEMHRFIPIYASWRGARVTEIPVRHRARQFGKSNYGLRRTIKVILDLMVVKFLLTYFQEPMYVFGGFGFLSFLGALVAFGFMVYYKFWGGKTFIETPLPLLAGVLVLVGVIAIFMGFLAQVIMMTYFESQGKKPYAIGRQTPVPPQPPSA
jgi:glycosyltransferase involved in cell wall biosynthesis